MLGASNCRTGVIHLARLGLQERDELGTVRRIEAWMRDNNQRRPRDESDRNEIRRRILAHLPVYALIDGDFRGRTDEQNMSVGGGLGDCICADHTPSSAPVLNDEPLSKNPAEAIGQ